MATKTKTRTTKAKSTKTAPRKTAKAKAKAPSRPRQRLTDKEIKDEERAIRSDYPNVKIHSFKDVTKKTGDAFCNKRSVVVVCKERGCKIERRIATSDVHQVNRCETHTHADRLARRREARAIDAAKAAKGRKTKKS